MTRIKRGDNIEKIHYGAEPEWKDVNYEDHQELLWKIQRAMNWYHAMATSNKNKKWYLEYLLKNGMKKSEVVKYSHEPKMNYDVIGGYCRMYLRGLDLPHEITSRINSFTEKLQNNYRSKRQVTEEKIEKVERPTIQERIKKQVAELCFILDQKMDATVDKLKRKEKNYRAFKMSDFCRENRIKKPQAALLVEYFRPQMEEVRKAYDKEDKDLAEGWSFLTRPNLKKVLLQYQDIIDTCEGLVRVRRARKKVKKNPERMIKNLRYLDKFPELDIKSKDPTKIIDCSFLVTYNTKTRELNVFHSYEKTEGLYIKGTTVYGYCEKKSKKKIVRKPETLIKSLQNSSMRVILDEFSRLSTKESRPSSRLNQYTIILQVI